MSLKTKTQDQRVAAFEAAVRELKAAAEAQRQIVARAF